MRINTGTFFSWRGLTAIMIIASFGFVFTACLNTASVEPDFNTQLAKDLATIDAYLASNGITAESDGDNLVRYVRHVSGTGEQPTLDSCITTHFAGMVIDSTTYFTSERNFSFPLSGDLIEGWKVMLPLMKVGDSVTVYVPSVLAYGYYGQPLYDVGSNVNVLFRIKLLHVGTNYSSAVAPAGSCN